MRHSTTIKVDFRDHSEVGPYYLSCFKTYVGLFLIGHLYGGKDDDARKMLRDPNTVRFALAASTS